MSILIAVPTYENVSVETFESIWDMDKGGYDCMLRFVRGYDCAKARNEIAKLARTLGVTHVLMIDSDVVVPKDALVTMMGDDVDVVLGYYQRRSGDAGKTTLCEIGRPNYDASHFADDLVEMRADGETLVEVKGGGMGCTLVRTDVFDRLPYPWFSYKDRADGTSLSEDYFFCSQCRRNGIRVYADTRVSCGHRISETRWLQ